MGSLLKILESILALYSEQRFELHSKLSAETALKNIDTQKYSLFDACNGSIYDNEKRLFGKVDRTKIELSTVTGGKFSHLAIYFYGKILSTDDGCLLKGTFKTKQLSRNLLLIVFIFLPFFSLLVIT